jgi:hypothetical protein
MSALKMPRTKRGARRQYDAIIRAYQKAYAGGAMFGMDWPTFRINQPAQHAHVIAMQKAFPTLPE